MLLPEKVEWILGRQEWEVSIVWGQESGWGVGTCPCTRGVDQTSECNTSGPLGLTFYSNQRWMRSVATWPQLTSLTLCHRGGVPVRFSTYHVQPESVRCWHPMRQLLTNGDGSWWPNASSFIPQSGCSQGLFPKASQRVLRNRATSHPSESPSRPTLILALAPGLSFTPTSWGHLLDKLSIQKLLSQALLLGEPRISHRFIDSLRFRCQSLYFLDNLWTVLKSKCCVFKLASSLVIGVFSEDTVSRGWKSRLVLLNG